MEDFARLLVIMGNLDVSTEDELIKYAMPQQVEDQVWDIDDIVEYVPLRQHAAQRVLQLTQLRHGAMDGVRQQGQLPKAEVERAKGSLLSRLAR